MGRIDDLFRKYSVKVNKGSGCLFQPDLSELPKGEKKYTYVLTAKHNIQDKDSKIFFNAENIKIYRGNAKTKKNQLKVLEIYSHQDKDKDAAILKVEYVDDDINLHHIPIDFDNPKYKETVLRLFGYPARRWQEKIKTAGVDCTVDMEHHNGMIEIVPDKTQFGFDKNTKQNIDGFSGCGVFKIVASNIRLVGIQARVADRSLAGDNLLILPMDYFNEIISQYKKSKLPPLIHNHLTSFKAYKGDVYRGFSPQLQLAKQILEAFTDIVIEKKITPMLIIRQLQETLCVPHTKDWVSDWALWLGWLKVLTYIAILEDGIHSDEPDISNELLKDKRIFYNNSDVDWYGFLKLILRQYPDGLKNVKYVITLQNSNTPQIDTKVSSKIVLPNIARPSLLISKDGIHIAGEKKPNDYLFIHLQEFYIQISKNRDNLLGAGPGDENRVFQELKKCIERAFSDD